MNVARDVAYRLALAQGFLAEAEQDFALQRRRSCYGDEESYTLPWDLFTQQTAEDALQSARRSAQMAHTLLGTVGPQREG